MPIAQPWLHPSIRRSTDADLAAVLAWLEQQAKDGVQASFWCNRNLTARAHQNGELLVYLDERSSRPLGYQWGGLVTPGILEVRNDARGRGIGKALVEHSLALAAATGEDLLWIQCEPRSSIPFWQRMGFTLLADKVAHGHPLEQGPYAYRVMPRMRGPWEGEATAQVSLEWFSERRKWDKTLAPVATQVLQATWFDDELELPERASFFHRLAEGDTVVRITVDGVEWYCDKAKYEGAESLGVEVCTNGFRVDTLYRPKDAMPGPHQP